MAHQDGSSSYKLRKRDGEAMEDVTLMIDIEHMRRKKERAEDAWLETYSPVGDKVPSSRVERDGQHEKVEDASTEKRLASAAPGNFELNEDLRDLQELADGIAASVSDEDVDEGDEEYSSMGSDDYVDRGSDREKEKKPSQSEEAAMRKTEQLLRQQLAQDLLGRHDLVTKNAEHRVRRPLPIAVSIDRRSHGGMSIQSGMSLKTTISRHKTDKLSHSRAKESPRDCEKVNSVRAQKINDGLRADFLKEMEQRLRRGKIPGTKMTNRGHYQSMTILSAIKKVQRNYDSKYEYKEQLLAAMQTEYHAQRKYVRPTSATPRNMKFYEKFAELTSSPPKQLPSRAIIKTNKKCVGRLHDDPDRAVRKEREQERKIEERRARMKPIQSNVGKLDVFARLSVESPRHQEKNNKFQGALQVRDRQETIFKEVEMTERKNHEKSDRRKQDEIDEHKRQHDDEVEKQEMIKQKRQKESEAQGMRQKAMQERQDSEVETREEKVVHGADVVVDGSRDDHSDDGEESPGQGPLCTVSICGLNKITEIPFQLPKA
jgi:hypothetical protein